MKPVSFLLILTGILVSGSARAYIPSSQFIVEKVAASRRGSRPVKVTSRVEAYEEGEATGVVFRDVTAFFPRTGLMKSAAFDAEGTVIYYQEREFLRPPEPERLPPGIEGATGTTGPWRPISPEIMERFGMMATGPTGETPAVPAVATASRTEPQAEPEPEGQEPAPKGPPVIPFADFLLFERVPHALVQYMIDWGIPVMRDQDLLTYEKESERRKAEHTRIRRYEEKVAWVIGNPSTASDSPQLWVEKDTFLPLRAVLPPLEGNPGVEFRFGNYRYTSGFQYPTEMSLIEPGNPEIRATLEKLDIITKNRKPERERPDGFTEAGSSVGSSLRSLVTRFYRTVR